MYVDGEETDIGQNILQAVERDRNNLIDPRNQTDFDFIISIWMDAGDSRWIDEDWIIPWTNWAGKH